MVKFDCNSAERKAISEIAERALRLSSLRKTGATHMDIEMDITATHANGCPLKLEALRDADDFNFIHDVLGIRRHLDRDTGKLRNCFLPRFAA